MHIIFFSSDRNLFSANSSVYARFARFAAKYPGDTFESVVFSTRAHNVADRVVIAPNMRAYATQSQSRLLYGLDAIRIARSLSKPDIISAQDPFETGLAARVAAHFLKVPYVVEVHTDIFANVFRAHSLLNTIRGLFIGTVIRSARSGYCVSAQVRDAVNERYRPQSPFKVLPIFVDTKRFAQLPHTPEAGALLWVGRFAQEKRPDIAIRALKIARDTGEAVRLVMLGSGPLEASLRVLAERLGVAEYVTFPGWQDPSTYLETAELLLSTSAYEGYGMAIVEALAAQVPVLSYDVGIAKEAGAIIVEGDYRKALVDWLSGPRNRGILKLATYDDEDEYFAQTYSFYKDTTSEMVAGST